MRNLVLISIIIFSLLLGVTSCSPPITKGGFRKEKETVISKDELFPFWSQQASYLYNMQIDFYKNHFSGLLIIKPIDSTTFRIVYNSHFGMSVFDFEVGYDTFIVNSCIEMLNKESVINTLKNDFRTILFLTLAPENNKTLVYKSKKQPNLEVNKIDKTYYLKDNLSKELYKIETPHFFTTEYFTFSNYQNSIPEKIFIKHSVIGLKITLDKITK